MSQEKSLETTEPGPIAYTDEELGAIREVRSYLIENYGIEESRIGLVFLALATINCKLRVEEAAKKVKKFLDIISDCGIPEGVDNALWKEESAHELRHYLPCGVDHNGSRIMWVASDSTCSVEEERNHALAGLMHFVAIHADNTSLRNGFSLVIDLTDKPSKKVGNESKLQKLYQAYPQRPQTILIAGTNPVTRLFVNAAIKIASIFTKQKVLDRIRFVTVEQAMQKFPKGSAPTKYGGGGGEITNIEQWTKMRLESFPVPVL